MASTLPVKGTRDFYPEDMQVRSWLYRSIRQVSESFGYQEYEGPFLETLDLYAAKSGEELVKKQSYVFADRSGEWITLRPELTPTLARMVAQRQRQLAFPLRWWSFGPMWRYEKPQKGRTREFFQWNIDLIGAHSPQADAELIAIAAALFREVGLSPEQVQILVNDRALVAAELSRLGIAETDQRDVLRLIDRRDKMTRDSWQAYAQAIGLQAQQVEGIAALLDDAFLWRQSPDLCFAFEALDALGAADYVQFAPHVVRGLDYYTSIVFEAWDREGEFRSVLGGGRYDNLVADVGGDPITGVGFAMGDVVISLILDKFGCVPPRSQLTQAPLLVTVLDEANVQPALQLASELRQHGLKVACYPQIDGLRRQLRYANRIGSPIAIIAGPDELTRGTVTVRDLRAHSQETIVREDVAAAVKRALAHPPAE